MLEDRCQQVLDHADRYRTSGNLLLRNLLLLLAIFVVLPSSAWAAGASVTTTIKTLPGVPWNDAPLRILTVEGRPVVLRGDALFRLGDDGRWIRSGRIDGLEAQIAGTVSDGADTALLLGSASMVSAVAIARLDDGALHMRRLPALPTALRSATGAWQDGSIYVAGVAQDNAARLYRYDRLSASGWIALALWPGSAPPIAVVSQNRGIIVSSADGSQWRWSKASGWKRGSRAPGPIVPGTGRAIGQAYLLYLVAEPHGSAIYSYSTITDAWARLGFLSGARPQVAAPYGAGLILATREGSKVRLVTTELAVVRKSLSLIDWSIVGIYLISMLVIGFHFHRKAKTGASSEFFLGSRSIPFWAAGLSMFAGSVGSVNYLAVPAKAFETDWQYMMSKLTTVVGLIIVGTWVVPIFRRLSLVSVFDYLETRFHPFIRLLSSALWIIMQLGGRIGVVLLLPALAIGTITDTSVTACIIVIGLFTMIYTAIGGMRAVVWTDVVQVVILAGGGLFAIGYIFFVLGPDEVFHSAAVFEKTKMLNFSLDVKQPTVWAFLFLMFFETILTFPKDQVLMQRVLSTSSSREAGKSVWMFAAILFPAAFMFYGIGTVLFTYYHANPTRLNPLLPIDAVFPAFIGTELPPGVVGLIVAGLIAAAMGTLSGIINSIATLLSVDFYERLGPHRSQRQIVRFAEIMSVAVGLAGIAIAILLSRLNIHSLLDLTIELIGLFGGSSAGAYPLGIFTKRANWQGVSIGIIASTAITLWAWMLDLLHPYLYLGVAIAASVGIGYLVSLLFPAPTHSLEGLTIYTRRSDRREEA